MINQNLDSFTFPHQSSFYRGKVRDVYGIGDKLLMITSDRISAFDVILPKVVPYKGQVLNQIAKHFLTETKDIVPNWLIDTPDVNVSYGYKCEAIPIEMVIRGYLVGHLWREYNLGIRTICGVTLPDGLVESQKLQSPIITPTTKAHEGHDADISMSEILKNNIVSENILNELIRVTYQLFERGQQMALDKGLILVDTKYEFGIFQGDVMLMDEIHTPDSSRYFYSDTYKELFQEGKPQKQLSKEFVREWLIENNFQGKPGQVIPEITDSFVNQISERYILLYKEITGLEFIKSDQTDVKNRIFNNVIYYLSNVN